MPVERAGWKRPYDKTDKGKRASWKRLYDQTDNRWLRHYDDLRRTFGDRNDRSQHESRKNQFQSIRDDKRSVWTHMRWGTTEVEQKICDWSLVKNTATWQKWSDRGKDERGLEGSTKSKRGKSTHDKKGKCKPGERKCDWRLISEKMKWENKPKGDEQHTTYKPTEDEQSGKVTLKICTRTVIDRCACATSRKTLHTQKRNVPKTRMRAEHNLQKLAPCFDVPDTEEYLMGPWMTDEQRLELECRPTKVLDDTLPKFL